MELRARTHCFLLLKIHFDLYGCFVHMYVCVSSACLVSRVPMEAGRGGWVS